MDNRIEQELMDAMDGCVKDGVIDFNKVIAKLKLIVTNPESIRKLDELEQALMSETDNVKAGASV